MLVTYGPRLTTCALQQVISYLGYSGHQINVMNTAARDLMRNNDLRCYKPPRSSQRGLGDVYMANGKTEAAPTAAQSRSDQFTPWYFLLVMSIFLLFWYSADYNLPLLLLWLPIALIGTVVLLVQAILCCLRRQGRRLASIAAAPFLAWAILASLAHMGFDSHWVRFQLQKWAYLEQIARCDCGPDGLRFKTFDWGDTGELVSPNIFYTLVYDESDEIVLSADKRTAAWKRKVGSGYRIPALFNPPAGR
jgi:hypothetical protein